MSKFNMSKFKVGVRIRETFSGEKDTGVITKPNPGQINAWYILWDESGAFPGEELWLYENDMELENPVVIEANPWYNEEKSSLAGETITIFGVQYRLTKI